MRLRRTRSGGQTSGEVVRRCRGRAIGVWAYGPSRRGGVESDSTPLSARGSGGRLQDRGRDRRADQVIPEDVARRNAELFAAEEGKAPLRVFLDDDFAHRRPPTDDWIRVDRAHDTIELLRSGRVAELSL